MKLLRRRWDWIRYLGIILLVGGLFVLPLLGFGELGAIGFKFGFVILWLWCGLSCLFASCDPVLKWPLRTAGLGILIFGGSRLIGNWGGHGIGDIAYAVGSFLLISGVISFLALGFALKKFDSIRKTDLES